MTLLQGLYYAYNRWIFHKFSPKVYFGPWLGYCQLASNYTVEVIGIIAEKFSFLSHSVIYFFADLQNVRKY